MGTRITTVRIDDFDGSEASTTWSLRVDGTDYEIDLSPANTARLTELLAPYIAAARKLSRTTRRYERKHNYITQIPNPPGVP